MAGSIVQTVRKTKTDGLDFYPTQPWATRALAEGFILPTDRVWEPACGGGHMAEVLREYTPTVVASDVFDYGYGDVADFLSVQQFDGDWIVTNPPFKNRLSERFARHAIHLCRNVAMLCRLSWLEGTRRHEYLFGDFPPTHILVFSERLGFVEGGCDVGRSGMVQYAWYVWSREYGDGPTRLTWLPGGTKDRLTLPTDAERFNRELVA